MDARANAIFPHEDEAGLCGFEKRNRNFKGFGDLGEKGLWISNTFPEDRRLVIGESAIDCISYEVLFPRGRYASIAGGLNLLWGLAPSIWLISGSSSDLSKLKP